MQHEATKPFPLLKMITYLAKLLWGSVACRLTPRTAIITRFPPTWFAGFHNDSRLRTSSGSTLSTGQEATYSKKLPTDWPHGSFFPRHLTVVSTVREKGGRGLSVTIRMFQDVSFYLVTFLCSRHVAVFPSLVLSVVRAFSAVFEIHLWLVYP